MAFFIQFSLMSLLHWGNISLCKTYILTFSNQGHLSGFRSYSVSAVVQSETQGPLFIMRSPRFDTRALLNVILSFTVSLVYFFTLSLQGPSPIIAATTSVSQRGSPDMHWHVFGNLSWAELTCLDKCAKIHEWEQKRKHGRCQYQLDRIKFGSQPLSQRPPPPLFSFLSAYCLQVSADYYMPGLRGNENEWLMW